MAEESEPTTTDAPAFRRGTSMVYSAAVHSIMPEEDVSVRPYRLRVWLNVIEGAWAGENNNNSFL